MGSSHKKEKASKKAPVSEPVNDSAPDSAPDSDSDSSLGDDDVVQSESDSEMEDEFDVAGVSSENESENEESKEGSDDEDDTFPMRKKKKVADTGSESFANAFNAILGSKLKAHDRNDPILARNKRTLKKLESDKLEAKAKRMMLAEKKEGHDRQRVKNLLPSADHPEQVREVLESERRLRKVAQKGVVKLFNAVLATQVKTNHEISKEKVGQQKKEELVNEISKAKFLDLVKAAGQT